MNSVFCYVSENQHFPHLDLKVSDLLEKNATPEARAAHIDLADWLIEFLEGKNITR